MTKIDSITIKKIVQKNFDDSVDLYEQFETKYGLFAFLTRELARLCEIQEGMVVLDIGCGEGTSTTIVQALIGTEGKVYGIDFSEKMLECAKKKVLASLSNIKFILSDANDIDTYFDFKLDAILYNASIFLIPEPIKTLQAAYRLLRGKGVVGMTYLLGNYPQDSKIQDNISEKDVFSYAQEQTKEFAPYGRKITQNLSIIPLLDELDFKDIRTGILIKKMSVAELKTFYSIPAQSAALWPKHSYEERILLLDSLLNFLQEIKINCFNQFWGWCTAKK